MQQSKKDEIINKILELLKDVNVLVLDNKLLSDILAHIIDTLYKYKLMTFKIFDKLNNLLEDDLKCLFKIFKKIMNFDKDIE